MDTFTTWVVGSVAAGALGVLGFLVRNAFDGVSASLKELTHKVDDMRNQFAAQAIEAARLEQRHHSLELRVAGLERTLERLSEGK